MVQYKTWIVELSQIIAQGILQKYPYAGSNGANTIFDGSYDWHSCVHAHWAQLSIEKSLTKLSGQTEIHFENSVSKLINPYDLLLEFKYLKSHPHFENPYGRSWLILLLSELKDTSLDHMSNELFEEMFLWLENSSFPEKRNEIIGTHKSWLFCYFLLQLSCFSDNRFSNRLKKLRMDKLEDHRLILETFDHNRYGITWDFIDRSSLFACIEFLDGRSLSDAHLKNLYFLKDQFLETSYENLGQQEAHIPGRLAMLSWPFAFFDQASHQEILNRIKTNHAIYGGDFHCFSHWVPQFIWMSFHLQNMALLAR
ncbi:DUF2891 family protein [bacterium]|nr:DUF2891 family protein [bacterium]